MSANSWWLWAVGRTVRIGICGQGHPDYPDLAEWLLREGIESMSLNPDTVIETWLQFGTLTANTET